jgi:type VI secretion system protein ImpK
MRLSDTFMELMSYTSHLLQEFETGEPEDYENVRQRYDVLYQRALKQSQEEGCLDQDWQEAWFAVCTWIDEMLLCSDWSEKDKWESRQLQRVYFQTMNGGEEFFIRLAALAAEKGHIREVYLYCLAMGFKGRFFAPEDEKKLTEIRQANMLLIHDPLELNVSSEIMFPEAYDADSSHKKSRLWYHGLSSFHLIVMAGSLLLLISLFLSFKNNLGQLVQAYMGA